MPKHNSYVGFVAIGPWEATRENQESEASPKASAGEDGDESYDVLMALLDEDEIANAEGAGDADSGDSLENDVCLVSASGASPTPAGRDAMDQVLAAAAVPGIPGLLKEWDGIVISDSPPCARWTEPTPQNELSHFAEMLNAAQSKLEKLESVELEGLVFKSLCRYDQTLKTFPA